MPQDGQSGGPNPDNTTFSLSMSDLPHERSGDELERELPTVMDGQIPLGDLLSRVMQAIYAELAELAETCVK